MEDIAAAGRPRREEGDVDTGDRLLTPGEVAALFRVDPKTVTRWAAAGRIGSIRTPGGHRRFRESEVRALLEGELEELGETSAGHVR
jgi:excisionase family DNA binding protein